MALNAAEWKGTSGVLQDPQLSVEQSQVTVCDPDTKWVIPKGTASLVHWMKATVRSVYPEKGDCLPPPVNAKQNTPDEAANMLCMRATGDWL